MQRHESLKHSFAWRMAARFEIFGISRRRFICLPGYTKPGLQP